MAIEVAKYEFQSWARRGISAHIKEQDTLGNPATALPPGERALVPIGVTINSSPQTPKDFALIGPGDIIGIHRDMIVRTEPRNRVPNVEPNYLAFIEFYDEDFAWRYTPAKPVGDLLRPWILLLVLRKEEFDRDDHRLPLPVITVKSKQALPPSDSTWLFAHVHTEQEIPVSDLSDLEEYLKSLQKAVTTDPDMIYCRLLSPRHLQPNTNYHAFLVPAFEAGRLAGLDKPTAGVPAQKPAWDAATTGVELPFYFDWEFSTGENQDFESLVKLLEPRVLDERVGIRSMDCAHPDFVKVDKEGKPRPAPPGESLPAANPTIQGLEGALKTDRTKSLPETFSPNAFQDELQILVNLPETVETNIAAPGTDENLLNDPIVTVPFYGQNHARQHKTDKVLLDVTKNGWYHTLNRDPRNRVPAAFGTAVIQKDQEKFMRKAWQQVEKVFEANRKIRNFRFMLEVSSRYTAQFFANLAPEKLMAVTAPVHTKVMGSPTTIRQQLIESRLSVPVFSSAFRRLTRPAGKLAQRLSVGEKSFDYSTLVSAVNEGKITPAPPRDVPAGIPSVDDLATKIQPRTFPAWLQWLIRNRRLALILVLISLLLVAIFTGAWLVPVIVAAAAIGGFYWLQRQNELNEAAEELTNPQKERTAIENAPPRPDFNVVLDGETTTPPATPGPSAEADSVEAENFRRAALELQDRLVIRIPNQPPLQAFDLREGHTKLKTAIDARVAFPFRLSAFVQIPDRVITKPEEIVDAMAHPDFEDPMYTYLRDINKELLIPNLQLIPPNTISLLETNPPFIESYMVGLNHEMGRELLWREFPTDMRGSYFRQFWEVKSVSSPAKSTDAEQLKDITKIHSWPSTSPLGSHKPPPPAGSDVGPGEEHVVLVIRGDLLKRYPNLVVYAQKAIDDGQGHNVIREKDPTPDQFKIEFKFPLFRADIDPDMRFYGFDLTIEKAKGTKESNDFIGDKRGWFFIIQEIPGEPRFGMDIAYQRTDSKPNTWNSLAWNNFGPSEPAFVPRSPAPTFVPPNDPELTVHRWAKSSAEMAYILFQTPVMVAVHATEMLDLRPLPPP